MANVSFKQGIHSKLPTANVEGAILYETDTGALYVDGNGTTIPRRKIANGEYEIYEAEYAPVMQDVTISRRADGRSYLVNGLRDTSILEFEVYSEVSGWRNMIIYYLSLYVRDLKVTINGETQWQHSGLTAGHIKCETLTTSWNGTNGDIASIAQQIYLKQGINKICFTGSKENDADEFGPNIDYIAIEIPKLDEYQFERKEKENIKTYWPKECQEYGTSISIISYYNREFAITGYQGANAHMTYEINSLYAGLTTVDIYYIKNSGSRVGDLYINDIKQTSGIWFYGFGDNASYYQNHIMKKTIPITLKEGTNTIKLQAATANSVDGVTTNQNFPNVYKIEIKEIIAPSQTIVEGKSVQINNLENTIGLKAKTDYAWDYNCLGADINKAIIKTVAQGNDREYTTFTNLSDGTYYLCIVGARGNTDPWSITPNYYVDSVTADIYYVDTDGQHQMPPSDGLISFKVTDSYYQKFLVAQSNGKGSMRFSYEDTGYINLYLFKEEDVNIYTISNQPYPININSNDIVLSWSNGSGATGIEIVTPQTQTEYIKSLEDRIASLESKIS